MKPKSEDDVSDPPRGFVNNMVDNFAAGLGRGTVWVLFILFFNWMFPDTIPALLRLINALASLPRS